MSKLSQIEETMLGPLWARAKYSKKFPELLNDKKAIEIIDKIDYNFSIFEEVLGEWRAVGLMIRARKFDDALKSYMKEFPKTTVVNLGAGLDTTFFRVDNGSIKMYNLDLPKVIKYREKLIKETERNQNLATSAFNYDWMNRITFSKEHGIFFIAGGFVYYFSEEKIADLMVKLAQKFSGGEIIFDSINKFTRKIFNKKAERAESDLILKFAINDPEEVATWSKQLKIKDEFVIGKRTSIDKKWKLKTKIMNRFTTWIKTARIIHLQFSD